MKIKEILQYLESIAPPIYQESYDNAGLIVGDKNAELKGALICLDSTEAIIEEAIDKGCNLVIAHHPIVFRGLKKLTGKNYVERVVIKAIQNDIAIYAIHTNLDNVYYQGVNGKIAETLGLENTRILAPKQKLKKLFVFVPTEQSEVLRQALFQTGAGEINGHQHLSYATVGAGTADGSGKAMVKLEALFHEDQLWAISSLLNEFSKNGDIQHDIISVENRTQTIGSGMIGILPEPMPEQDFLTMLKEKMKVACIRHTALLGKPIHKVALCGGSGGFLLSKAIGHGADIFITADYKYHDFFDADQQIIIADIGHYESEQYTINLLNEILTQKFSNFAAHITEISTNPVNYFY